MDNDLFFDDEDDLHIEEDWSWTNDMIPDEDEIHDDWEDIDDRICPVCNCGDVDLNLESSELYCCTECGHKFN